MFEKPSVLEWQINSDWALCYSAISLKLPPNVVVSLSFHFWHKWSSAVVWRSLPAEFNPAESAQPIIDALHLCNWTLLRQRYVDDYFCSYGWNGEVIEFYNLYDGWEILEWTSTGDNSYGFRISSTFRDENNCLIEMLQGTPHFLTL